MRSRLSDKINHAGSEANKWYIGSMKRIDSHHNIKDIT